MAAVTDTLKLFLAGDIMTARGIDSILPHPGDPRLYEAYVKNAGDYVRLAERLNGSIPRPVDFTYVWGAALEEFELRQPHARIINLETAVSRRGRPEQKGINYRMSPENFPVISAAGIDCCMLANTTTPTSGPQRRPEPANSTIATGTSATLRPNTVAGSM